MARVTGIGGVFFRAADPAAIKDGYAMHLGITAGGVWTQEAGPTVYAPFAKDTGYFGRDDQQWMINLRVEGLADMIARLQGAGITVETRADWDGDGSYGKFARIHDPEGNPIELWEPPASA